MTVPVLIEERPDASGKVAPRRAGFRAAQGLTQPSSPQVLRSMALVLPRFFQDVDKAPAPSDSKVAPPARAPPARALPRRSRSSQQRGPSLARLARGSITHARPRRSLIARLARLARGVVRDATPFAEMKQARPRLLLAAATQPPARPPHARRGAARRRLRCVCFLSASSRRWHSAAIRTRASRSSERRSSAACSAATAWPLPPCPPVPPPPWPCRKQENEALPCPLRALAAQRPAPPCRARGCVARLPPGTPGLARCAARRASRAARCRSGRGLAACGAWG